MTLAPDAPGMGSVDGAWVLGVDSGGSGLRVALARRTGPGSAGAPRDVRTSVCAEPVRTGPSGIDPDHMAGQLVPAVRALLDGVGEPRARLAAVCVGAAGMVTLGDALRARLPDALAGAFDVRRIGLAADAVTAYAGALGERPGAVVAAGTGVIAMGTDLRTWRRADGWGHLLGDCGSGAWIGRAGLEAAMRAHDGREGGSEALRATAEAVFGPLNGLAGQLYPRSDRPAVLASFAPEVARCAGDDPLAAGILRTAAAEIATSTVAACPGGGEDAGDAAGGSRHAAGADGAGDAVMVAFTGGLFRLGEPLMGPLRGELARRLPLARVVEAAGDPLDGALLIADRLAEGQLTLPATPPLLTRVEGTSRQLTGTD